MLLPFLVLSRTATIVKWVYLIRDGKLQLPLHFFHPRFVRDDNVLLVEGVVDERQGQFDVHPMPVDVVVSLTDHNICKKKRGDISSLKKSFSVKRQFKLTHCVVIVKVDEAVLSLGLVLVGDPKGPSDEAKVGKVLHQLGVVNAVFQAAHKHRLRLVRKLYPRTGQIYPNPLSLCEKTTRK